MNEENTYSKYDFWDIEFNSRSYVYRQVYNRPGKKKSIYIQIFTQLKYIFHMTKDP